jgi:uncharacterized Tic20 family protein
MGFCATMPTSAPTRRRPADRGALPRELEQWEQTWAMWAHLGALLATIPSGFLLQFLVPLIIWLSQRDRSDFVADHAREALNFQLSMLLWWLIGLALTFVCVGVVILVAVPVVTIVCGILASIAAGRGEYYRYPVTFRIV